MTAQVTQYVLFFSITLLSKFTLASVCTAFYNSLLLDESEEEERTRLATKEEEDVNILQSWMEVGGFPAHPEEEAKGLLAEVNPFPCFFSCCLPLSISYLLPIPPSQSWHWIVIGYFLLLFRG